MSKMILFVFGILLLPAHCYAESANETSCIVCHHMEFEYRNMPKKYRDIYENALNSEEAGLQNSLCLTSVLTPLVCDAPLFPEVEENRCLLSRVTMHLQGLINHIPRAEMIVILNVRGCTTEWKRDPNGCKDFSELTQDEQGALIRQLHPLQRRWKIATFFGTICTI